MGDGIFSLLGYSLDEWTDLAYEDQVNKILASGVDTEGTIFEGIYDYSTRRLVPAEAYLHTSEAEAELRKDIFGGATPTQDELNEKYTKIPNLLATPNQKPDQFSMRGPSIRDFYSDGTYRARSGKDDNFKDLPTRPLYEGGLGASGGGPGGPVALPVDFRYSPFIEPSLLDETFEIEAVLRAAFLPAFRPGENAIIPHPDRHATIRVMTIDKEVVYATTNFFMEGYNKATKESFKIIESTLGNTLQLNKEKFKLFKMKLGLVDAQEPFDWLRSWEDKWDRYMRASVLARNRWRWYILFGSHLIGGYPLQYSLGADAKDEPFTGISVDIFVTDDVLLPEMKRLTTEAGLVYFKWGGTTYNPDNMQFEETIPEYPSIPAKATSPDEAEFENEP